MEISIRFGTIEDLTYTKTMDKHINPEYFDWKLRNNEILLAEVNNKPIGYLRLEYIWTKIPYIGLIIIEKENRKKGIGKALIDYLETHLKRNGHTKLYSSSQVNEEEPQSWHRNVGFKEAGIINGINEGEVGEVFFVKDL